MRLRHKFNAVRIEADGIKFPSKKEAKYYLKYKALQEAGEIIFFLRQVPFYLSGGVKYVCDFQIFWTDGTVEFIDVKGMKTPVYTAKKKMVEATYPIKITEV